MADFAGKEEGFQAKELLLLVLCVNLTGEDAMKVVEELKSDSKKASTHKRRQLYWEAYTAMSSKLGSMEGTVNCFVKFVAGDAEGDAGSVEIVELTKRQRGLMGSIDIMGKKVKPPEDSASKGWAVAFSEDDVKVAWDDLHSAEPCIYITADAVYTATRFKRCLCKGLSGMPKTVKDVEKLVSELAPENPIRNISFTGNDAVSVNSYNTFLVGSVPAAVSEALPPSIGHCTGKASAEIYNYFLSRHSDYLLTEASKLISQMNVDVAKGLVPLIVASSMKDAGTARKNSLMKRVFIHESKKAFIARCQADGEVEMHIIRGNVDDSDFGKYGGVVFELFYRADLSVFG